MTTPHTETESLADWACRTAPTLTDEEWCFYFEAARSRIPPDGDAARALLAELDRIAGELTSWDPWALRRLQTWATSNAPRAIAMGLLDAAVGTGCATIHDLTPLGRAVLRRSQETKR